MDLQDENNHWDKIIDSPILIKALLTSEREGRRGKKKGIKEKITDSYQILPVTLGPVAIYSQV